MCGLLLQRGRAGITTPSESFLCLSFYLFLLFFLDLNASCHVLCVNCRISYQQRPLELHSFHENGFICEIFVSVLVKKATATPSRVKCIYIDHKSIQSVQWMTLCMRNAPKTKSVLARKEKWRNLRRRNRIISRRSGETKREERDAHRSRRTDVINLWIIIWLID